MAKLRISKTALRENLEFYLFISPWIIGFIAFSAGPIITSFSLSLTEWDLLSPPQFVGAANYANLIFKDDLFWQSLKVTVIYSAGSITLHLSVGLVIALLMNQNVRGILAYRTIYYLPSVVSGVAVSLLFIWIFNKEYGILNYFLSWFGIKGPDWLASRKFALPSLIIMSLWGAGGPMLIYLAGLQGIPTQLYEAAIVDGAGVWQKFCHITIPMISPVILFNLIMGFIHAFQVFTEAFVMTSGGPGYATYFYVLYLYMNAFKWFKMGMASAQAWILFALILLGTLIIFKTSSRWVYYEAERRR
ncbi:MAG: carbohydrate ABC transporter permease [bacterium]